MTGLYVATALGGVLKATLTAAEVEDLWNETDEDLREEVDGEITLWARGTDHPGRLAPIYIRPAAGAA
jgi:hypothetical protein